MESPKNTVLAFLISLLCFATNAISSENEIILNQNRHTGISETYIHDNIKSWDWLFKVDNCIFALWNVQNAKVNDSLKTE